MTKSSIDRDWIGKQISEYAKVYARYEEYTNFLYGVLKTTAKEIAPLSIVQARTKPISSFADKIFRKRGKHADPVRDFTDLSGARVIVRTREYIQPVCDFIKEHFNIDWENSLDVSELLKPSEFGYRSIHYIVSLSPDLLAADDMKIDIPRTILPDEAAPMKAEIQVRTLLQHAW